MEVFIIKKKLKITMKKRENDLKSWEYSVTRFKNEDILKQVDKILAEINSTVKNLNNSSKKL